MQHRISLSTTVLLAVRSRKKKSTVSFQPIVQGILINKTPLGRHRVTEEGNIILIQDQEFSLSLQ